MEQLLFFFELLPWLILGHIVADVIFSGNPVKRSRPSPNWSIHLTYHALVNGAAVAVITQSYLLGYAEAILHWVIDYVGGDALNDDKTKWYRHDQFLHIICKVIWAVVAVWVLGVDSVSWM